MRRAGSLASTPKAALRERLVKVETRNGESRPRLRSGSARSRGSDAPRRGAARSRAPSLPLGRVSLTSTTCSAMWRSRRSVRGTSPRSSTTSSGRSQPGQSTSTSTPPRRNEGRGRGRVDPVEPGERGGTSEGETQPVAERDGHGGPPVDADDQAVLHLAGVVFRDDADALSRRLLGVSEAGTRQPETASLSGSG